MIRKVLGTFLLLFFAELTFSQTNKGDWVDSVYNSLTLEQRLGQLFIMPTYGSGNEQHLTIIKNTIDRYTLGGVKIMEGNAQNISRTNNDLKNHANLPLLSFITITNGFQSTVHKAPAAPSLTTLGALQSDSLKEALAKATQRQMTLLGSNLAMLDVFEPTNANLNKTYSEWVNLLQGQNLELVLGAYPGLFDPKSKLDSEGLRSFTALLKDKIKIFINNLIKQP